MHFLEELKMRKITPAFMIFLITSITLACFASIQFPIKKASANGFPAPIIGQSYTWNILATNGPVKMYDNNFAPLNTTTLSVGGTFQYNLTGNYTNNQLFSSIPGKVMYGDFGIYYNSSGKQILNWTRKNCSTTEIGANLALSASGWQGGLIAPTNWAQNLAEINAQPKDYVHTLQANGMVVIDYSYYGQWTHLEYYALYGVLTYARTSFLGFNMEITLSGISLGKAICRIGYNSTVLKIGTAVHFWDESYLGSRPFSYQWSFGDGAVNSTVFNPDHTYSTPGTYNVTLTVTDHIARVNKTSILVVIHAITPSSPQNLQATTGSGKVMLTWQAPAADGGVPITSYKIYRGTSPAVMALIATTSAVLNYTDTNVTNGQAYYYKVSAVNSIGEGSFSAQVSATPSAAIPGYQVGIIIAVLTALVIAISVLNKRKFRQ